MHKKIKLSKSNLLLKVVAYVVMGLLAAMAILPCLHIRENLMLQLTIMFLTFLRRNLKQPVTKATVN